MAQLLTAGLVVTRNKQLLLAFSNNKNAWYLPGGKTNEGESPADALVREIREELNFSLNKHKLVFYMHITAQAFGEAAGIMMEQDCFLYNLTERIRPSAEIAAVKYFSRQSYSREP